MSRSVIPIVTGVDGSDNMPWSQDTDSDISRFAKVRSDRCHDRNAPQDQSAMASGSYAVLVRMKTLQGTKRSGRLVE